MRGAACQPGHDNETAQYQQPGNPKQAVGNHWRQASLKKEKLDKDEGADRAEEVSVSARDENPSGLGVEIVYGDRLRVAFSVAHSCSEAEKLHPGDPRWRDSENYRLRDSARGAILMPRGRPH